MSLNLIKSLGAYPVIDTDPLTLLDPGNGVSQSVENYKSFTCQFSVASIDTSVTCRLEGSTDGTGWFNLDEQNQDATVTSNGNYSFISPIVSIKFVRFVFVSEDGGTNANVTYKYYAES